MVKEHILPYTTKGLAKPAPIGKQYTYIITEEEKVLPVSAG